MNWHDILPIIGQIAMALVLVGAFAILIAVFVLELIGPAKDDSPDAPNREEYEARMAANSMLDGAGIGTRVIVPCPFCGARGLAVWGLLSAIDDMGHEETCQVCKRSSKVVLVDDPQGKMAEVIQTGGPELPAYLRPFYRRVEGKNATGLKHRARPRRAAAPRVLKGSKPQGGA